MTHNALKMTLRYIATIVLVVSVVLILNYALLLFFTRYSPSVREPARTAEAVAAELDRDGALSSETADMITRTGLWVQLVDPGGDVIYAYRTPGDVGDHYSLQDIARLSKSFLHDYPVYTWESGENIVILGYPRDSIAKYNISLPTNTLHSWPLTILAIAVLNIVLAVLLSVILSRRVTKPLDRLIDSIFALHRETPVHLTEKGVYRDLAQSINDTSAAIADKNQKIKRRDQAVAHWIAGISHDVRTPLSMILGYSALIGEDKTLPEEVQSQAGIIAQNAVSLRDLVSNLNLATSLELDIPVVKSRVRVGRAVRDTAAACINSGMLAKCTLDISVENETAAALLDESLFARAISNLVLNSARHNPGGCDITITVSAAAEDVSVTVADNGRGIPAEALEKIDQSDFHTARTHGLGLILVKSIVKAHGGRFTIQNPEGEGAMATIVVGRG